MLGLAIVLAVQQLAIGASPTSYAAALKDAEARNRPLVVLVGANWCPGCQTMKHRVLPRLAARGRLASVNYVVVDSDQQPQLASQLMRGNSIPQLIVFSRSESGWQRSQITGAASEQEVQSLIDRAVAAQQSAVTTAGGGH